MTDEVNVASDDLVDVLDPAAVVVHLVHREGDHLGVLLGETLLQLRNATELIKQQRPNAEQTNSSTDEHETPMTAGDDASRGERRRVWLDDITDLGGAHGSEIPGVAEQHAPAVTYSSDQKQVQEAIIEPFQ